MLFSALFLFFFFKYYSKEIDSNIVLSAIAILFIQSTFSSFSVIFRPEIMVMFFGFCSWVSINRFLDQNRSSSVLMAGLFAGLAALTHLNGLIFILAGFTFLLIKKEFRSSLYFGFCAAFVLLFYFWDINNAELFGIWIEQFKNDPTQVGKNTNLILEPFVRLISEHKRFFHSGEEIVLTLLFFFSVGLGWKKLYKSQKNILVYLTILIIFLALISHGKTVKYQILYMPFMAVIISYSIHNTEKVKKYILLFLLSLFCIVNLYSNYRSFNFDYNPIEMNSEIANKIEEGAKVLAKERFFFNEGTRFTINSPIGFAWYYERYLKEKYTLDDFFVFSKEYNIDYIIIDKHAFEKKLLKLLGEVNTDKGAILNGYRVVENEKNYLILKLIQ